MKTISLTVDLTFSEDISDDQIKEVAENVLNSLVSTCNEAWLAPTKGDAYTESITVSEQFTRIELSEDIVF